MGDYLPFCVLFLPLVTQKFWSFGFLGIIFTCFLYVSFFYWYRPIFSNLLHRFCCMIVACEWYRPCVVPWEDIYGFWFDGRECQTFTGYFNDFLAQTNFSFICYRLFWIKFQNGIRRIFLGSYWTSTEMLEWLFVLSNVFHIYLLQNTVWALYVIYLSYRTY